MVQSLSYTLYVRCFLIHGERVECFLVAAPPVTEHGKYGHRLTDQITWFELPIRLCTFNAHPIHGITFQGLWSKNPHVNSGVDNKDAENGIESKI